MDKRPSEKPDLKQASAELNAKIKEHAQKRRVMKEYLINGKKVRVISLDDLKHFATRFAKISQFYFIGAVLMLSAGIYFGREGSILLPKLFLGFLVFCVLMTLLSFRLSYKASKVVDMIDRNRDKH